MWQRVLGPVQYIMWLNARELRCRNDLKNVVWVCDIYWLSFLLPLLYIFFDWFHRGHEEGNIRHGGEEYRTDQAVCCGSHKWVCVLLLLRVCGKAVQVIF